MAGLFSIASGGWLGSTTSGEVKEAIAVAAALVGVVVGAVVAGMAIQTAGFDRSFLRELAAINRDPAHYLSPFLATAVIDISALLMLLAWAAVPNEVQLSCSDYSVPSAVG